MGGFTRGFESIFILHVHHAMHGFSEYGSIQGIELEFPEQNEKMSGPESERPDDRPIGPGCLLAAQSIGSLGTPIAGFGGLGTVDTVDTVDIRIQ